MKAILDTDFIINCKRITTRQSNWLRFFVENSRFDFLITEYTLQEEIKDEDIRAEVQNLIDSKKINLITDRWLIEQLKKIFSEESSSINYFDNVLRQTCEAFGRDFYQRHYSGKLRCNCIEDFLNDLKNTDQSLGIDNNTGEIKCFMTLKMMNLLAEENENISVFCSDDRKARTALISFEQTDVSYACYTTATSFVCIHSCGINKNEVSEFIEKYAENRVNMGQGTFDVYDEKSDNDKEKVDCLCVLQGIWSDDFTCNKLGKFIKNQKFSFENECWSLISEKLSKSLTIAI